MDWEVIVVDDSIHNAVYIAGGKILFYMSWWSFRRMSDAQIATTIGHEVGLAVSRHYAENWIKLFWAICLLSILSNFFPINCGNGNFFHPIHLWHSRRGINFLGGRCTSELSYLYKRILEAVPINNLYGTWKEENF
ncbi:hypothetical protein L1049_014990 [Liquidambar formosana]|uniref:Peptidase M48 domain-containing protein n=1 Tax=Liquidambar formosana TaxID=63359 RepID=A0AAP0RWT3_LIQFO